MKISNKYIEIENGSKKYNFKNFMMNNYLKYFVDTELEWQNSITDEYLKKTMRFVCLKIDNPFEEEINPDTNLTSNDFEIYLYCSSMPQTGNQKKVEQKYIYQLNDVFYYNGIPTNDKSLINGKKIYAIGFGSLLDNQINAYVDVSAYNIRINSSAMFDITRVDVFESDAECVGQDFPIHLAPKGKWDSYSGATYTYLYSVGLGYNKNELADEYIIGTNIDVTRDDDFSFSFDFNNPSGENEIYPAENLYPASNLYPNVEDYKYVIYRYKLYNSSGLTGEEYTMNYKIDKIGNFNIKTILENIRGGV